MSYVQNDKVTKAENDYYTYTKNNKPGEFASEYTDRAKAALDDYTEHGDFKYDPATDSGYQAARKQYTAGGRQAMKDTLGVATELTGGFDNSYAQVAAQQAYNGYMSELAALMPEFESRAYGRWQDEGQRKLDYYTAFKAAEADDYGRYRDKVADYHTEADRLYGIYGNERSFDYGKYQDNVANDQWERTFAHQQAKDNAAAATAQTNAEANYYEAFAKYNNSLADNAPTFYEYAGAITDDDGERTGTRFYYDGKEKKYDLGVNPYTNTTNPDVKNGTFDNGYQPDSIGGKKLIETKYEPINLYGKDQKIFKTVDFKRDGDIVKYYIWNGKENRYVDITDSLEEDDG